MKPFVKKLAALVLAFTLTQSFIPYRVIAATCGVSGEFSCSQWQSNEPSYEYVYNCVQGDPVNGVYQCSGDCHETAPSGGDSWLECSPPGSDEGSCDYEYLYDCDTMDILSVATVTDYDGDCHGDSEGCACLKDLNSGYTTTFWVPSSVKNWSVGCGG